jgi:excisionase family DNA binding protein
MELEWITPQQAADLWGVSARRVQALCITGQIKGIHKLGRVWLIPKDTPKPQDGRARNGRKQNKQKQEQNDA